MTFCKRSPPKHRNGKPHGGHSHGAPKRDYSHGMRGHSYRRMEAVDINGERLHIGRMCNRCNRTWIL